MIMKCGEVIPYSIKMVSWYGIVVFIGIDVHSGRALQRALQRRTDL